MYVICTIIIINTCPNDIGKVNFYDDNFDHAYEVVFFFSVKCIELGRDDNMLSIVKYAIDNG